MPEVNGQPAVQTSSQTREKNLLKNCPLCGAGLKFAFKAKDYLRAPRLQQHFEYFQCQGCSVYLLNPPLTEEELAPFYQEDFFPVEASSESSIWVKMYKTLTRAVEFSWIGQFKRTGRVLDYGCGTDNFWEYFQRKGFEIYGYEPSKAAQVICRQRGMPLIDRERFLAERGVYDLITMIGVVEHVGDPQRLIQECFSAQASGGIIYLLTPNADSWQFKLFGKNWAAIYAPRHLFLFSKKTMYQMLSKAGYQVAAVKDFIPRAEAQTFFISFFPWLHPMCIGRLPKGAKKFLCNLLYVFLTLVLTPILFAISLFYRQGAMMVVVARKR